MDIDDILQRLLAERDKIIATIATLEHHQPTPPRRRRGRKFMDEAERLEVSARMKKYWAGRKLERSGTTEQ